MIGMLGWSSVVEAAFSRDVELRIFLVRQRYTPSHVQLSIFNGDGRALASVALEYNHNVAVAALAWFNQTVDKLIDAGEVTPF